MTYSPYGDRDSGGTRTDVDTEVHDDHDLEDRAGDDIGHDANGHDANGHDANGRDGTATPFQRDSTDDESIGGHAVDQDGNVVEATDGDVDGGDRPEAVDDESAESADSAESAEAPGGVDTEHTDAPDAEANADDIAVADTEAGTDEGPRGDVQADDAMATGVDSAEHVEGTDERDGATEQAMAGDDAPTEVPAGVVDEHNRVGDDNEVGQHGAADAMADGDAEREPVDSEDADAVYPGGEPVDAGYADAADPTAANADPTADNADPNAANADPTADNADPNAANADPTAANADSVADDTGYADDAETDGAADADAVVDDGPAHSVPDGDAPTADAVDADYVAVGVAEPMTESEVADIAGAGDSDATGEADDGAAPPLDAAPFDAAPFDAAAADGTVIEGTAVGMMPGDAPVLDAPAQVPNADATHDRWQQIQLGFIDDPRGSVESARSLVVEAVEARISALRDRQAALDGWQSEATPDTEVLRAAIQGYRDMLNSLTDTP